MNAPRFDATITLGHVLTAVPMLVVLIGSAFVFDYRLRTIEERIANYTDFQVALARHADAIDDLKRSLAQQSDWRVLMSRNADDISRIKERLVEIERAK